MRDRDRGRGGEEVGGKPVAAPLLPDSVSLPSQDLLILHLCTGRVKRPIGLFNYRIKLSVYLKEHSLNSINSRKVSLSFIEFNFHSRNV